MNQAQIVKKLEPLIRKAKIKRVAEAAGVTHDRSETGLNAGAGGLEPPGEATIEQLAPPHRENRSLLAADAKRHDGGLKRPDAARTINDECVAERQ